MKYLLYPIIAVLLLLQTVIVATGVYHIPTFGVNSNDMRCIHLEYSKKSTWDDSLANYSYTRKRKCAPGDSLLFRPFFMVVLAVLVNHFPNHNLWWLFSLVSNVLLAILLSFTYYFKHKEADAALLFFYSLTLAPVFLLEMRYSHMFPAHLAFLFAVIALLFYRYTYYSKNITPLLFVAILIFIAGGTVEVLFLPFVILAFLALFHRDKYYLRRFIFLLFSPI